VLPLQLADAPDPQVMLLMLLLPVTLTTMLVLAPFTVKYSSLPAPI
jgi:hypothetical protein